MRLLVNSALRWRAPLWVVLALAVIAQQASAEMLVQSLDGDATAYRLLRDGQEQRLLPLGVLKAGDKVEVLKPQGVVTLAHGDGEVVVVSAANSPFAVPEEAAHSWMDNAMLAALEWYQGVSASEVQAVSLVTREGAGGAVELQGMDLRRNFVPAGLVPMQFRWTGGQAPFRVSIVDRDKRRLVDTEVEERRFVYSGDALPEGRYIVRVEGQGPEALRVHEQIFYVTKRSALPSELVQLEARPMAAELRQHLTAVMLARYRQWRFTALQYALLSQDDKLSQALLAGRR